MGRGRKTKEQETKDEIAADSDAIQDLVDDYADDGEFNNSNTKPEKPTNKSVMNETTLNAEAEKEIEEMSEIEEIKDNPEASEQLQNKIPEPKKLTGKISKESQEFIYFSVAKGSPANIADKSFIAGDEVSFTDKEIKMYSILREYISNGINKTGKNRLYSIRRVTS